MISQVPRESFAGPQLPTVATREPAAFKAINAPISYVYQPNLSWSSLKRTDVAVAHQDINNRNC